MPHLLQNSLSDGTAQYRRSPLAEIIPRTHPRCWIYTFLFLGSCPSRMNLQFFPSLLCFRNALLHSDCPLSLCFLSLQNDISRASLSILFESTLQKIALSIYDHSNQSALHFHLASILEAPPYSAYHWVVLLILSWVNSPEMFPTPSTYHPEITFLPLLLCHLSLHPRIWADHVDGEFFVQLPWQCSF